MKKIDFKMVSFFIYDLFAVFISYSITPILIQNFTIYKSEIADIWANFYWIVPIYILVFLVFKLYLSLWEYASVEEAFNLTGALLLTLLIIMSINFFFEVPIDSNEIFVANFIVFVMMFTIRFGFRLMFIFRSYMFYKKNNIKTLVIGAGNAGIMLIREIRTNKYLSNNVVCFIDDDKKKVGKLFQGIKVVGTTDDLSKAVKKYKIEEIIIAIPSASKPEIQRILNKCDKLQKKIKILPPFYELIDKSFSIQKIRDVKIEDLLGREVVKIDNDGLYEFIHEEVVLVTGGGGSIGSELCRQIIKYEPKKLLILDIYENNAYDIQNELCRLVHMKKINSDIEVLIASVRDDKRIEEIFKKYNPTIVFHAAAHKHVPLMELSPKEAIKNNVFGTYNVAKISHEYNVKKFVLISTDKAVNPTNIMGATKRMSEMIIQAFDKESKTHFSAVRFGNVLGSNGSVIPLFRRQIEEGGPVTVTHKDIIRYFMTIPEAVELVLQAGAFAKGGEIFVLDMGEPVRILDLAEKLIRYSGFEPYNEINITFTGLRPGEKLYEELLMEEEGLINTENKKIFVLRQIDANMDVINKILDDLSHKLEIENIDIKKEFSKYVTTYKI